MIEEGRVFNLKLGEDFVDRREGGGVSVASPFYERRLQSLPAMNPPSTNTICPVTKSDASDAKNIVNPAKSSGSPQRYAGVRLSIHSLRLSSRAGAVISVRMKPGAMPFTWNVMLCPLNGEEFR